MDKIASDNSSIVHPSQWPTLDTDKAKELDQMLSWEDSVSLTFLMVDEIPLAYQLCRRMEEKKKNQPIEQNEIGFVELLALNASKHQNVNWQLQVYEALYLTENYSLLDRIGIKPEVARDFFSSSGYVQLERRRLHALCANIEEKAQRALTMLLLQDAPQGTEHAMMETQMLHFMEIGVVKMENNCWMNLMEYLKLIDQTMVSYVAPPPNNPPPKPRKINSWHDDTKSLEDHYEMGPGLCIIINQKTFYVDPDPSLYASKLEDRIGTDRDRDELDATFTMFGAEVVVHNNLTHKQIDLETTKDAVKANNSKYYWLVVCILSHGRRQNGEDEILGCNGVPVIRKQIIQKFTDSDKCPALHQRPKLFFFQACRGTDRQQGIPPPSPEIIQSDGECGANESQQGGPNRADFFIGSATIEDFVSYRSTEHGSFFIRHLCNELQENGHKLYIEDIMREVNRKVFNYRKDHTMMPEYSSALTKKLIFARPKFCLVEAAQKMLHNQMFYSLTLDFVSRQTGINTNYFP